MGKPKHIHHKLHSTLLVLALFTMASIGSAQHLSAGLLDVLGLRSACTWLGLCDKTTPSGAVKPTVKRKSPKVKPAHPSAGQGGFTIPSQHGAPVSETIGPKAESKAKEATPTIPRPLPPVNPSHTVSLPETPSFEELCAGGNEFACGILRRNQDQGDWRIPPGFIPTGLPMARPGGFMPMGQMPPVPWNQEFLRMSITQSPAVPQRFPAGYSAPTSQGQIPFFVPMGAMAPVAAPHSQGAANGQNQGGGQGQTGGGQGNNGNGQNDDGEDDDDDGPECDNECSCTDGRDNDANGLTDNDDPVCEGHSAAVDAEDCFDGVDNDRDDLVDADDPDCEGAYDYEDYEDSPNFSSTGDSTSIYYYDFQ